MTNGKDSYFLLAGSVSTAFLNPYSLEKYRFQSENPSLNEKITSSKKGLAKCSLYSCENHGFSISLFLTLSQKTCSRQISADRRQEKYIRIEIKWNKRNFIIVL
jgi:hypothetical protein